jgi:uncharacterized protein (TIGR02301 family)
MKALWRRSRPGLLALGLLAGAIGFVAQSGAPARAQFFFPFFDNRPTTAPNAGYGARRRAGELHHRPKAHKKQNAAGKNAKSPEAAKQETAKAAKAAAGASAAPQAEGPPPPYEPQLLRLSEIMGALSYLQPLCGVSAAKNAPWRAEMENLMNAEDAGPSRREKLAGAFNRGLRGYEYAYHACTPSARLVSTRFLDEGARIAHDISTRYRAN